MRRKCIILVLIMVFCASLSAQDEMITFESGTFVNNNEMIIHASFLPLIYRYNGARYSEGIISNRNLYKALTAIPENNSLIKAAKVWEITGYISVGVIGLSAGILSGMAASGNFNEIKTELCLAGIITGSALSLLSVEIYADRIVKAVDNYNLTVAGLKIPKR